MNNAEYFLKDEVMKNEFIEAFKEKYANNDFSKNIITLGLSIFFEEPRKPVKPTLAEDERVILRNINKRYEAIGRTSVNGDLYLNSSTCSNRFLFEFDHLFQFIKRGEEYSIKELLGGE